MPGTKAIAMQRLLAEYQRTDPDPKKCWIWAGAKSRKGHKGHGIIVVGGIRYFVHRLSFEWCYECAIPRGMWVLHDCPGGDDPACWNPYHLFLGTPEENVRDMMRKGRAKFGGRSGDLLLERAYREKMFSVAEIAASREFQELLRPELAREVRRHLQFPELGRLTNRRPVKSTKVRRRKKDAA